MSKRFELYRMMSKLGPAAVLGHVGTKAAAEKALAKARAALKMAGVGGKVKVVVRDTSKRINPKPGKKLKAELDSIVRAAQWGGIPVSRRAGPGGWTSVDSFTAPDKPGKIVYSGGKRKNPTLLLATNPGEPIPESVMRDPEFKRALAKYRQFFNGDDPIELIRVTDAPRGAPKFMVALGRAPDVTYKPADHTSKRGIPFQHTWDEPPFLALSADEKFLGFLGRGKGYKVKREGIHG